MTHRQREFVCSLTSVLALLTFTPHLPGQTYATVYNFGSTPNDGAIPSTPLVAGSNGLLYGTTQSGSGSSLYGTVFSLAPPSFPGGPWTESVLYAFTGASGYEYPSSLVVGPAGVLYGATYFGGTGQCAGTTCGTVFSLTPPASPGGSWTLALLHDFQGGSDGAFPQGPLAIGNDGVLFGTTTQGGAGHRGCQLYGCGTVFSLTPPPSPGGPWIETLLYTFALTEEGIYPQAGVIIGKDGVLYGTTEKGGPQTCNSCSGTVFALYPPAAPGGAWIKRILHTFLEPPAGGEWPAAPLVMGRGGVIYGTTTLGGGGPGCGFSCGTVFSLTPPPSPGAAWTEAVLFTFPGFDPYAADPIVSLGPDGVLYGVTWLGGTGTNSACFLGNCGTVFSLTPPPQDSGAPATPWTASILHSFAGPPGDGNNPLAGLLIGPGGLLIGTTSGGSVSNPGTIFALKP